MQDYKQNQIYCLNQAQQRCEQATTYTHFNFVAVVSTAILAGAAAVTSATNVPWWVTTVSAALSAVIGVLTTAYRPEETAKVRATIGTDFRRLASRWAQCAELEDGVPPDTKNFVEKIQADLDNNVHVDDEARWAAARVPEPSRHVQTAV